MKKGKKQVEEKEMVMPEYEGEMVEVKKERKVLNIIINVILVVAIIIAVVATYVSFVSTSGNGVPSIFGIRPFSIQTDSMYPEIKPGDLILDKAVKDVSSLKVGDVITYWTVINGERVLNTHRIQEIYDGGGYRIFSTKGDNSDYTDSLTVHESEIVGKYWVRIGGVGKVFDYLQTSTGFLICVVVPVAIFFLYHLVQFFRVLFEYQNVKNKIKYEQERGRNEDILESEKKKLSDDRAALEAELREKLKKELLEDMKKTGADTSIIKDVAEQEAVVNAATDESQEAAEVETANTDDTV